MSKERRVSYTGVSDGIAIVLRLDAETLARARLTGTLEINVSLEADTVKTKIGLSKEQLIDAYENQGMSLRDLATMTGLNRQTIRSKLQSWGVDTSYNTRNRGGGHARRAPDTTYATPSPDTLNVDGGLAERIASFEMTEEHLIAINRIREARGLLTFPSIDEFKYNRGAYDPGAQ